MNWSTLVRRRVRVLSLVIVATALVPTFAVAKPAPEAMCQAGRLSAKGKYEKCIADSQAKLAKGLPFDFETKIAGCRIRYAAEWGKLQRKYPNTTCDQNRYEDNGDGTITDHLTGLDWEKKSHDGDIHDYGALFSWTLIGPPYANGTVFTAFLRDGLNFGAGFAGSNDWRIPTLPELLTILLPTYPCTLGPCVAPVFDEGCIPGCTVLTCSCAGGVTGYRYVWASTALGDSWAIDLDSGTPKQNFSFLPSPYFARGVRGGL